MEFYEFFAGGGMARLGLGPNWNCTFANEWCEKKAATYVARFGDKGLLVEDVRKVTSSHLPGHADLAWASFPCQDLSLAGAGAGLSGERSGMFHHFWRLMMELSAENRIPQALVLENVVGTITSHNGEDFHTILKLAVDAGFKVGAMVVDAKLFLPQSRPRLFIVASRAEVIPAHLTADAPDENWHPKNLCVAHEQLPQIVKESWVWWRLPLPEARTTTIGDLVEAVPSVKWHSPAETEKLLSMMNECNAAKVREASLSGRRVVGTIYKRIRSENGTKFQRAEVRFDGTAGCLRTPAGGSSRQIIIDVNGNEIKTRLLSSREAASLMGVPSDYPIPEKYNEAYHLFGDGVAVPVVSHLRRSLLTPLVQNG